MGGDRVVVRVDDLAGPPSAADTALLAEATAAAVQGHAPSQGHAPGRARPADGSSAPTDVRADAVVVCDYDLGVDATAIVPVLDQDRPTTVVVDAHDLTRWSALRPDLVTPNAGEAAALLGRDLGQGAERAGTVVAARDEVLAVTGARNAVVTLDRDGTVLLEDGAVPTTDVHRTRATPASEQQASGAGDTFCAAASVALAVGDPGARRRLVRAGRRRRRRPRGRYLRLHRRRPRGVGVRPRRDRRRPRPARRRGRRGPSCRSSHRLHERLLRRRPPRTHDVPAAGQRARRPARRRAERRRLGPPAQGTRAADQHRRGPRRRARRPGLRRPGDGVRDRHPHPAHRAHPPGRLRQGRGLLPRDAERDRGGPRARRRGRDGRLRGRALHERRGPTDPRDGGRQRTAPVAPAADPAPAGPGDA